MAVAPGRQKLPAHQPRIEFCYPTNTPPNWPRDFFAPHQALGHQMLKYLLAVLSAPFAQQVRHLGPE